MSGWQVRVDRGGTFDNVARDPVGALSAHKLLTKTRHALVFMLQRSNKVDMPRQAAVLS